MSKLNSRRGSRGTIGTAVLASLCCAGAVAYALGVGFSLASWPDQSQAAGAELETVSGLSEEDIPEAPVGQLQVQVSDRDRAYIQNLTCTGDREADPAACAEIAESAAFGWRTAWQSGARQTLDSQARWRGALIWLDEPRP
jgi:hypothetical protein